MLNRAADTPLQGPRNLLDRQGMADLKRMARSDSREGIAAVARQFESLFVGLMLESMRSANLGGDPLFGSSAEQTYQRMFDQQLALQSGDQGLLGIGELLLQQLRGRGVNPANQETAGTQPPIDQSAETANKAVLAEPVSQLAAIDPLRLNTHARIDPAPLAGSRTPGRSPAGPSLSMVSQLREAQPLIAPLPEEAEEAATPADFLQMIQPLARMAAEQLGVPEEAIAGQAVLESGWGAKTIRYPDGGLSYNLFGIKAGPDWQGEVVQVPTLEYRDGVARREVASFRAYGSYAEAFDDYVDFLRSRPWYASALSAGNDSARFAQGLQQGGYATDPAYAEKVTRLADQLRRHWAAGDAGGPG